MAIRKDVATVLRELSKKSGIHEGNLSKRFHQIKSRGTTPGPKDINWIDDIPETFTMDPAARLERI